jgi:hypothetical protein
MSSTNGRQIYDRASMAKTPVPIAPVNEGTDGAWGVPPSFVSTDLCC